jgi:predicted  nucleic acid-binding Zn-ribbon protein
MNPRTVSYQELATISDGEAQARRLRDDARAEKHGAGEAHVNGKNLAVRVSILESARLETRDRLARIETRLEATATKADLADLKGELKTDMAALRGELKGEMAEMKAELKSEMAEMKIGLRSEMAALGGELRGEMSAMSGELRGEIAGLRADMYKMLNAQTWRLVTFVCTFGIALSGGIYFIAAHFH